MAHEQTAPTEFILPTLIFGLVEVRRLKREIEALNDYLAQAAIRNAGEAGNLLPRVSRLLEALAAENHLNLLQSADRLALHDFLDGLIARAPVIHMSFASDPSAAFTARIVTWLRASINPYVLLQIGLQPTIAAGCMVRTTNRSFDFSLRHRFDESRQLLLQSLDTQAPAPTPAAAPVAAPAPVVSAVPVPQPQAQAVPPGAGS